MYSAAQNADYGVDKPIHWKGYMPMRTAGESILSRSEQSLIDAGHRAASDERILLANMEAVLQNERTIARQINVMLATQSREDPARIDMMEAKLRLHRALQAQEDSRAAFQKSMENLSTALELIGYQMQSRALSRLRLNEGYAHTGFANPGYSIEMTALAENCRARSTEHCEALAVD